MMMSGGPAVGSKVYTSDGEELGDVKEVRDDRFKVDVSMMPDYWLPNSAVTSADAGTVRLAYPKDSIGDHKVDKPADGM
jgi:hypothetical protein